MKDLTSISTNSSHSPQKSKARTKRRLKIKRKKSQKTLKQGNVNQRQFDGSMLQQSLPANKIQKWSHKQCKRQSLHIMYSLFKNTKYTFNTYWQALQILSGLQFEGCFQICVRVAAAVFYITSKYNQTYKATIQQLIQWSAYKLNRQQIIETQYQILNGLEFIIPNCQTYQEAEIIRECHQLSYQILNQ